jgi:hypothetical protein
MTVSVPDHGYGTTEDVSVGEIVGILRFDRSDDGYCVLAGDVLIGFVRKKNSKQWEAATRYEPEIYGGPYGTRGEAAEALR